MVESEWGTFEGAAFEEFQESIHVVKPFPIPAEWDRFESMDHGANNPTAWHAWAADHDGNLVVFDEYYSPGPVSSHAPEIKRRRASGRPNAWEVEGRSNTCWADPSIRANHGLATKWGQPASVSTEYREHGLYLGLANNDRTAGYLRLLELLHVEPGRIPPAWSRVRPELGGAPRLYVFKSCEHLIEQLKSAPVAEDGADFRECVDSKWESAHGHAVASLRYGAMSRPGPSPIPEPEGSPQAELLRRFERQLEEQAQDEDDFDLFDI
jgi:hypothetical protein